MLSDEPLRKSKTLKSSVLKRFDILVEQKVTKERWTPRSALNMAIFAPGPSRWIHGTAMERPWNDQAKSKDLNRKIY